MTTLIVLAKQCLPGRVKTRLSPPFTPVEAARLAESSLRDTLEFARRLRVDRRLLWFAGAAPAIPGFEIAAQPAGGLDERIAAAFDAVDDRALLIGMDTPQLDPRLLQHVLDDQSGHDAWFGPATDGGFWALGLNPLARRGDLIRRVPMSTTRTGAVQLDRLVAAGLRVQTLPHLTDVDDLSSAREVAAAAPTTRFARLFQQLALAEAVHA